MRLFYATRWGENGTFVFREDGPVMLVRALGRRTDVSKMLDLTLPMNIPEQVLNAIDRAGEQLATMATRPTPVVPRS